MDSFKDGHTEIFQKCFATDATANIVYLDLDIYFTNNSAIYRFNINSRPRHETKRVFL